MGVWDKIKDFIGIDNNYYEDEEYYEEVKEEDSKLDDDLEVEEVSKNSVETSYKTVENTFVTSKPSSKSYYKTSKSGEGMIVTIKQPLSYEDGKQVLDDIISKKAVILNLEKLEMDKKTQIFYFVSGGLYSLRGSIQNVTKDIYVLVPEGMAIDGNITKVFGEKSLY